VVSAQTKSIPTPVRRQCEDFLGLSQYLSFGSVGIIFHHALCVKNHRGALIGGERRPLGKPAVIRVSAPCKIDPSVAHLRGQRPWGPLGIANSHSAVAPTFEYEYSHGLPGREAAGATHSAELGYVFGTLVMGKPGPVDLKIAADLQSHWTNFAKSGDPNGQSVPAWPRHGSVSQACLEFTDGGPVEKTKLRNDICHLYEEALEKR